jgi:hypothetical protein
MNANGREDGRMRSPASLCVSTAALLAFAACLTFVMNGCAARFHVGNFGDNVDRRSVEQTIQTTIGGLLRAYDSKLAIGPSHCPDRVDVSDGKTATCTLLVNGARLPVRVLYGGPPQQYRVTLPNSFFEGRGIERLIHLQLLDQGVNAMARCPVPDVTLIPTGTKFSCALSGKVKAKTIKVKIGDKGFVWIGGIADLQDTQADKVLRAAVAQHAAGRVTVLHGSFVSAYIDRSLAMDHAASQAKLPGFGPAVCALSVDLTGTRRGVCTASIQGQQVHFQIWIDSAKNFSYRRTDAILEMAVVEQQVEAMLNQSLRENGFSAVAKIDCGGGLRVAAVGSHVFCPMIVDNRPAKLDVEVRDAMGAVKTHIIMPDATSSHR